MSPPSPPPPRVSGWRRMTFQSRRGAGDKAWGGGEW